MDLIADFVLSLAGSPWIYLVALLLVIFDGFFPLFPSEVVIVGLSALAASNGTPQLVPLFCIAALGSTLADNAVYALGRRLGRQRVEALNFRPLMKLLEWADKGLETRPSVLVLVARFIPWARLAVNITAGSARYSYRRFIPLCLLASTLWAIYNVAMGYLAGRWFGENPLLGMVIAIAFAVIVGIILDTVIGLARRRNKLGV